MLLTKFSHSCVRLEKDGRAITIDPGTLSEAAEALTGAEAVLITHEHADHIDIDAVVAALPVDVYAPAGVAATLRAAAPEHAARIRDAVPGQTIEAAGFTAACFGGQHALIHATVPVVANVGYVIDDAVYHPGDSLVVPHGVAVSTVLVPVHAPWSKVAEVIDFLVSVRAPRAFQIHDGLLNETGLAFTEAHLARVGAMFGTEYRHLALREDVEL
ncbi:MBL fold metallo-hydrolase [Specibacter cremeus]|uniref:MBL fold metallo-hydrolase n=1 Tax=Specibacter cremeus TaxID=1629051 RepID=UPI000F77F53D|nr:MBL fold metallo-hydrolase [Specibacter cremeus]